MVRAVEVAGLGVRIWAVIAALLLPFGDEHIEEIKLGVARNGEVPGAAPNLPTIGVDHAGGLGCREERVLGIIFRT